MTAPLAAAVPRRQLSLVDVVCLIVGIIIGSGIYRSSPFIAANTPSPYWLMFAWASGGLIALVGALCYAELATAYPAEGGDYVFLTKAFGRQTGFVFVWTELWIVRPSNLGAVAYVFAEYARELLPLGTRYDLALYAVGAVVLVTGINVLGVRAGKWTQNSLTALKVAGLFAIFGVALFLVGGPAAETAPPKTGGDFRLAIVVILFTYGGWKDISYVAAEVQRPEKNLLWGLVLGTGAVLLIYLLVNLAFIRGLGFAGFQSSEAVAAELLKIPFGEAGGRAISGLICISCLGAMNGMVFTGARVFYALGTEHRLLGWLGHWNPTFGAPIRSLLVQGVVALGLIGAFARDPQSFERLVFLSGPFFWTFMVLVGVSIFILRRIDPKADRPYRVLLYPLTPLLFCASSAFMVYSSGSFLLSQHRADAFLGLCVVGLGVILGLFDFGQRPPAAEKPESLGKGGKTARG